MINSDFSAHEHIFKPRSLAVIGASSNPVKFGGIYLRALIDYGFKGKLYPVNIKEDEIQGLKAWPTITDIPDAIDLAVITVPDRFVIDAVKACAAKGVKGVQIITSGFRESGDQGKKMEEELVEITRQHKIRIIGPNCFGIYSPKVGLTLLPGVDFSKKAGEVGFISQSGGGACDVAYMARGRNVYFSVMVSYGNGCDIEAVELLRYFEQDPETKVIGAYIEGINNGRAFFKALKSCARKKPVVILKGGLTNQGRRGTMGHTGSMAGSSLIWPAAIKAAGAVAARDTKDLVECLMAFQCLETFSGNNAGVLAGGGLRCVEALDAASDYGFIIPKLNPESLEKIQKYLPPSGGVAGNPIDLANPMLPPKALIPMLKIMADQDDVQFLLLYQMLFYIINALKAQSSADGPPIEYHTAIARAAVEIRRKTGKPLAIIMPEIASDPAHSDIEVGRITARYHYTSLGIPCFDESCQTFSVLKRVKDYYSRKSGNVVIK